MKYINNRQSEIVLTVSLEELKLLSNCINEALLLGDEFQTRVGHEQKFAEDLWREIGEVISQAGS